MVSPETEGAELRMVSPETGTNVGEVLNYIWCPRKTPGKPPPAAMRPDCFRNIQYASPTLFGFLDPHSLAISRYHVAMGRPNSIGFSIKMKLVPSWTMCDG
jgi:hypothetical protein